jgi:agmatinase
MAEKASPQQSFLGVPNAGLDDADVAVISAPFEGTVSYGRGTGQGPAAILAASEQVETFDEELGWDLMTGLKIATLPPVECDPAERPEAYLARLKKACAGYGLAPPFPLGLGGEHSVTPAILAGVCKNPRELTIVQIDAHADLRTEYGGTIHNHACAMRRLLEMGAAQLIAIGIRSACQEEFELIRGDERIHTYWSHQLEEPRVWDRLREQLTSLTGPVYFTVDIDGLEVHLCPGTGTPQPGGLSWSEALRVARWLLLDSKALVIGADITETVPQLQSQVNELVAAKLAVKILSYRFFREKTGREPLPSRT